MVTKDEVRVYLRKVEIKAQDAIREKHKESIESCWIETQQLVVGGTRIGDLYKAAAEATENFERAAALVKAAFPSQASRCYIGHHGNLGQETKEAVAKGVADSPYAFALQRQQKDLDGVASEYKKLRGLVDDCRNGKKAVEMLQSYGFDTSWITSGGNSLAVNKDLLFPCKERGV